MYALRKAEGVAKETRIDFLSIMNGCVVTASIDFLASYTIILEVTLLVTNLNSFVDDKGKTIRSLGNRVADKSNLLWSPKPCKFFINLLHQ
jgi:hypothetical protein